MIAPVTPPESSHKEYRELAINDIIADSSECPDSSRRCSINDTDMIDAIIGDNSYQCSRKYWRKTLFLANSPLEFPCSAENKFTSWTIHDFQYVL